MRAAADFAELDGRMEYIGLQIRSCIEDVEGPERPLRRRYREPGPPLPVAELAEMIGRRRRGEPPLDCDDDAAVGGDFEEADFAPRALRGAPPPSPDWLPVAGGSPEDEAHGQGRDLHPTARHAAPTMTKPAANHCDDRSRSRSSTSAQMMVTAGRACRGPQPR